MKTSMPRYSVSLVYKNVEQTILRSIIIEDAYSKQEALGKAIECFDEETKGLYIFLKTTILIE